ncbi:MAG: Fur family transcriptional regulator [Lentihominibacter sp.]|jgi:Fe2+ or Zn2+ uptake regulation protein
MKKERNTTQKEIIGNTVRRMTTHPTAEEVVAKVHEEHPGIGRATVYRALKRMVDKGDLKQVRITGGADRFDFRTEEHHHFKCNRCGRVFDLDAETGCSPDLSELLGQLGDSSAEITGVNISFEGICKCCKEE